MIRKILFLTLLLFFSIGFSQETVTELKSAPNPFREQTTISFESSQEQGVFLIVRNVLGRMVYKKAFYTGVGERKITFERGNLPSGMYIYTIQSKDNAISKRFVIE